MKKTFLVLLAILFTPCLGADTFVFKYEPGTMFKALGTNRQTVYLNGELVNKTKMVTKIAYSVIEVRDGKGLFDGQIQVTSERDPEYQEIYNLSENYGVVQTYGRLQ